MRAKKPEKAPKWNRFSVLVGITFETFDLEDIAQGRAEILVRHFSAANWSVPFKIISCKPGVVRKVDIT